MKKNRAFTLVELLAVIVILAIVLIIAVPGVLSIINQTKEKSYQSQLKMIKEASKNYLMAERDVIDWTNGDGYQYTYVAVDTMQEMGYLENNVLDPRTKKPMDHYLVRIEKPETGSIVYNVLDSEDVHSAVPEGLIVQYDGIFNQEDSHGTPTVWKDLSGHGIDITLHNFSDPTTSWKEDALSFNGVDNVAVTEKQIEFGGSGQHTVEFWVSDYALLNLDTVGAFLIVETTSNFNNYQGAFFYSYGNELSRNFDSNNHFQFAIRKSDGYFARFVKSASTDFHSVIVVVDTNVQDLDGQMKVYLDGKQAELDNLTIDGIVHHQRLIYQPFVDAKLTIGNRTGESATPWFWKGNFHNLKIYNRALTENEVQANYFVDRSRFQ